MLAIRLELAHLKMVFDNFLSFGRRWNISIDTTLIGSVCQLTGISCFNIYPVLFLQAQALVPATCSHHYWQGGHINSTLTGSQSNQDFNRRCNGVTVLFSDAPCHQKKTPKQSKWFISDPGCPLIRLLQHLLYCVNTVCENLLWGKLTFDF